jgi:hypothetical protein
MTNNITQSHFFNYRPLGFLPSSPSNATTFPAQPLLSLTATDLSIIFSAIYVFDPSCSLVAFIMTDER